MQANLISSPTFRYLGANFAEVEFQQINPKPWSNIDSQENVSDLNNAFKDKLMGINEYAVELNKDKANSRKIFHVKNNIELESIHYDFTNTNSILLDDIKIQAEIDTTSNFIIDYKCDDEVNSFRNSTLYIYAKQNSTVNIYLVSREGNSSKVFQSIGIITQEKATVNLYQVEMGMGNKVFSCHSYANGNKSILNIENAYFTQGNQTFDMLYNADIYGTLCDINISVNGILKDNAKKIFRGTLDFKKGAKGSNGSEEEYVTLLDKTVRSKSLPVILCSEENITGNHAASAGQIDEQILFYIMSRGFSLNEAKTLIVKARLVPVIDKIPNEQLREELLSSLKNKMLK